MHIIGGMNTSRKSPVRKSQPASPVWLASPSKRANKKPAKTLQEVALLGIHQTREYTQSDTHTSEFNQEAGKMSQVYSVNANTKEYAQPQPWHNEKHAMKMTDDSVNHLTRKELRYGNDNRMSYYEYMKEYES